MNIQSLKDILKKLNLPFGVQKNIDLLLPNVERDPSVIDGIIALIEAEAAVQDELARLDIEEQTIYEDLLADLQTLSIQMQAEQDEILAEELEKAVQQMQDLSSSDKTSNNTPLPSPTANT